MDNTTKKTETFDKKILSTTVSFKIYILIAFTFVLIVFAVIALNSAISLYRWALLTVFLIGLILSLNTFKTITLYENGIHIKYLLNNKNIFIPFTEIENFTIEETRASMVKMKNLKLIYNSKQIVISSFIYKNVDIIHDEIVKNKA